MRVVFDHQIFAMQEFGGISRYFQEMGRELARDAELDLKILAPLFINHHIRGGGIPIRGFFIPKMPVLWKKLGRFDAAVAKAVLGANPPDIVHETYYSESPCAPAKSKIVLTVYDMIHEKLPRYFSKSDPTYRAKLAAVKRADHIFCISESTRKDLIDVTGVDAKKTSVTYLANSLAPLAAEPAHPLGGGPYLLHVGPRGGYKNYLALLRAYARSEKVNRELALICFGGGGPTQEEHETMRELRIPEGKVIYVSGEDEALKQYYARAAAFVYPSLYEGFGIPVLEAMSFGCPVLCGNTSSIPEVGGEAAEYFDPADEASIAAALEKIAASETRRRELRTLGLAQEKRFSWERCAQQTKLLYKSL